MRLTINGRNIDVTPSLREYAEEKIGRITKHNDQITKAIVTLSVNKNPSVSNSQITEVTCSLNGAQIHVKEEAETMYASIDLVADKLDRQVKKHKDKMLRGKSGNGSIRTSNQLLPEEAPEEETEETLIDKEDLVEINIQMEGSEQ